MVVCKMREIELNETCNYVHLMSGGLDSAFSLLKIAKEKKEKEPSAVIHPIFFDYGQFAAEAEWSSVTKIVEYVRSFLNKQSMVDNPIRISLESELFQWSESDAFRGIEGKRHPEIENRNLVLFSVLASYLMACANHQNIPHAKFSISSGFKEEEIADCNRDFFGKYSELLSMYKPDMEFHFEILENWSRQKVIKEIKVLLDASETKLKEFRQRTISCYSPSSDGKPCGKCSKCIFLEMEKMKAQNT
jgi:7-cyano-7-deazaguanine synthase in queuosine biosynthesis